MVSGRQPDSGEHEVDLFEGRGLSVHIGFPTFGIRDRKAEELVLRDCDLPGDAGRDETARILADLHILERFRGQLRHFAFEPASGSEMTENSSK